MINCDWEFVFNVAFGSSLGILFIMFISELSDNIINYFEKRKENKDTMRKLKVDMAKLQYYLIKNKDRSIQELYCHLKNTKFKYLSNEEILVYSYLKLNKRKLGLR